jgi:hypothetical protein
MRSLWSLAAVLCLTAWSAPARDSTRPDVVLYVSGELPAAFHSAKATTGWMFARIGVRIEWRETVPSQVSPGAIRVRFLRQAANGPDRDALAYAEPFRNDIRSITVLVDQIERMAGHRGRVGALLAHTLAHEIGHVLEGSNAHADTGVMKARWTASDFDAMCKRPLEFAKADVEMITEAIRARAWMSAR